MLDPDHVDLDELAEALDDHSAEVSYGHSWWLDPRTGGIRFHSSDVDDGETIDDLDEAGLILIEHFRRRSGMATWRNSLSSSPTNAQLIFWPERSMAAARSGDSRTRCPIFPSCGTSGSSSMTRV